MISPLGCNKAGHFNSFGQVFIIKTVKFNLNTLHLDYEVTFLGFGGILVNHHNIHTLLSIMFVILNAFVSKSSIPVYFDLIRFDS